ncbi:hypothetical protein MKEN_00855300 [Mycena kentingensis (nom. inval.)]|nr:hypothetical protein MKEN_00855300 [Mycena kentingensis (nom. inval.)]
MRFSSVCTLILAATSAPTAFSWIITTYSSTTCDASTAFLPPIDQSGTGCWVVHAGSNSLKLGGDISGRSFSVYSDFGCQNFVGNLLAQTDVCENGSTIGSVKVQ